MDPQPASPPAGESAPVDADISVAFDGELDKVLLCRSLEEIKDALLEAYADLMGLGAFDAVEILVDQGVNGSDTCDVTATFEEKSMLHLHSGTYVQGTEGTMEVSLNVNNALGYAEQIAASVEYGLQRSNVCSLSLTKPRPWGRPLIGELRFHQLSNNFEKWSSFTELLRGGVATLTREDGRHALSYELGWRRLSDPSWSASPAVVGQLGDQIKSAASHIFKTQSFDDPSFPMRGWGLRNVLEVAGLGVEDNLLPFFKQQVVGQVVVPVWPGHAALHLTAEAGVLLPWGAKASTTATSISDRFFLGGMGSGSLRGFAVRGVGPSDGRRSREADGEAAEQGEETQPSPRRDVGRDALGGDLFCSLLASLKFRLPHKGLDSVGLHGHVFANGGNLVGLGRDRSARAALSQLTSGFRWSVGVGIEWASTIGRLELNLATVVRHQEHDRISRGIQFGIRPPLF